MYELGISGAKHKLFFNTNVCLMNLFQFYFNYISSFRNCISIYFVSIQIIENSMHFSWKLIFQMIYNTGVQIRPELASLDGLKGGVHQFSSMVMEIRPDERNLNN